jgi:hypothetical protein
LKNIYKKEINQNVQVFPKRKKSLTFQKYSVLSLLLEERKPLEG